MSILACMMLLSLVLRYPRTPHELGVDSFFIHNLATSIVKDGNAEWILSPLSLFGWYPLSYPSGGPILVATFADLSGQPIEGGILLLSMGFGALGVPMAFAMARDFRDDDLFCLAVAFTYAYAPRYLAFTLWSASMRSLFMVLLPLFIWAVLRTYRDPRLINFALVATVFLVLAVTHRLAILMAIVLVAFLATILLQVALKTLRLRFPRVILASPFRRATPYLTLGAFAGAAGVMIFGTDVLNQYSTGELFSGFSVQTELLNFGVSLARSVGLGLLFAFVGVFVMVRSRNKTLREPFLLLAFIGLTPTLFLRVYTGFYILPFIAIFAGLAILGLSRVQRRKVRRVAIGAFFAASLVFSTGVLQYEIDHVTSMPTTTYTTALYAMPCTSRETVVANDGLLGIRFAAISSCNYLPVGGAGTTFQSPELLAYHYFAPAEVWGNMSPVPLRDLTLDSDSPWFVSTIQAEADWVKIMQSDFNATNPILTRYAPVLYLENKNFPGGFFAFGNDYASTFAASAYVGAYRIYDADAEALWYVGVPR
jgi:hypothetical protein